MVRRLEFINLIKAKKIIIITLQCPDYEQINKHLEYINIHSTNLMKVMG